MTGPMPLARRLGEMLYEKPLPELEQINLMPVLPTRRDLWPPEVWAQVEGIRKSEED